jgi:hypothetical protein
MEARPSTPAAAHGNFPGKTQVSMTACQPAESTEPKTPSLLLLHHGGEQGIKTEQSFV